MEAQVIRDGFREKMALNSDLRDEEVFVKKGGKEEGFLVKGSNG